MTTKIKDSNLDPSVITGNTELAEAANNADTVLIHDTSASALKKIQVSNLTAQAGDGLAKSSSTLSVDIPNTTLLNAGAATNDELLIYDTSAGALRSITQTNLLNFPTISSVSPTNAVTGDGTGNFSFVITGTGFTGATATLVNNSGSNVAFDSQTVDSDTQITGVIAKSSLLNSGEPFDVKVTAGSGLTASLLNQINVDAQPVFSTAAGSLGTAFDSGRASFGPFEIFASDPESAGDVTYTLESGSIPSGMSFASTSSGAVISGTPDAVGSNTTSTFTIRAKDNASNTSDRQFTITINAPSVTSFTSSGTFSVPSGLSSVDVLVVAGGAGGAKSNGNGGGGGGAGGLIYRPGFAVTPGGTISVTVGDGGAATTDGSPQGSDSVFGTLTAKGGGAGGQHGQAGNSGGSGGGAGRDSGQSGGTGTQPTQSGESGNYGFGNPGGSAGPGGSQASGGGGGAGAAGVAGYFPDANPAPGTASRGGAGKSYSISGSAVEYAGGGSGTAQVGVPAPGSAGAGGSVTAPGGNNSGQSATANRGSGGGAGRGPTSYATGAGGKGVVIVSF